MQHPLPVDQLPEAAKKAVSGPAPLRMMTARAMAPLPAPALVSAIYFLSFDADEKTADAAKSSFAKLALPILAGALASAELHAYVLDHIATHHATDFETITRVVQHPNVDNETVVRLARTGTESLCELIATNEQRLLLHPEIIEALYYNRATRMSTADRIIDLAARNKLELNINGYKDICSALQNQLIPEAGEELPSDTMFREALAEAEEDDAHLGEDDDIVEKDDEGAETLKGRFQRTLTRIQDMSPTELIRAAQIGPVSQRLILVRSPNRMVAKLAADSKLNQPSHAARIAASREVSAEILRIVYRHKEWLQSHQVKSALATNPKTPPEIATGLLPYLRDAELRRLSRNRNVTASIKSAAGQLLAKRTER